VNVFPEMTYNVFSGMLNPTHFTSRASCHEEFITSNSQDQ